MSKEHRYLRGDTREIHAPVHGFTVVEKGDFMVICKNNTSVTHSAVAIVAADQYAYPATSCTGTTATRFAEQFAGVAMKGSVAGTTENIPIATAGIFRYPAGTANAVYPGYVVHAVTSAAQLLYNQKVGYGPTAGAGDLAIGLCMEYDATGTNIDFNLITRFSGVSWGTLFLIGTA